MVPLLADSSQNVQNQVKHVSCVYNHVGTNCVTRLRKISCTAKQGIRTPINAHLQITELTSKNTNGNANNRNYMVT